MWRSMGRIGKGWMYTSDGTWEVDYSDGQSVVFIVSYGNENLCITLSTQKQAAVLAPSYDNGLRSYRGR